MRHHILILAALAAVITSCSKSEDVQSKKSSIEDFIGQVQSISLITSSSDSTVKVKEGENNLLFEITPHAILDSILAKGTDFFSLSATLGKDDINIPISSVSKNSDGTVAIVADCSVLGSSFFGDSEMSATATLVIKYKKTEKRSGAFLLANTPSGKYLKFISHGTSQLGIAPHNPDSYFLEYSRDKETWTEWKYSQYKITFDKEHPIYVRGLNPDGFKQDEWYGFFEMYGDYMDCKGSVMSLIDYTREIITIPSRYCFAFFFYNCEQLLTPPDLPAISLSGCCYYGMFSGCSNLINAPELPATILDWSCYSYMFEECTSLTQAPKLPATSLASECYSHMFDGCISLTQATKLPATSLAYGCYSRMFLNCTSLVQAPVLSATDLAEKCYEGMFAGCTSLTQAPDLPAADLAESCYKSMFAGCTSLTQAPKLSATDLAESCYKSMFEGCTSLTQAPKLSATDLAQRCYEGMFGDCTSLIHAPDLPATTLANYCYYRMFSNCNNLINAPGLPATTLAEYCYYYMFEGCTSLAQAPDLPATDLAGGCYSNMFEGCTSLAQAPDLPATDLTVFCYAYMFRGCTSLIHAPDLPATIVVNTCYWNMFEGCSNLSSIVCLAKLYLVDGYREIYNLGEVYFANDWLKGVSESGVFYKSKDADWGKRSDSGIPEGWTVVEL